MDCIWINKINETLSVKSKEDWYTEIYESSKKRSIDNDFSESDDFFEELIISYFETELLKYEEKAIVEFFEYLNLSIISGECFLDNFIEKLDSAINNCGTFIQHVEFDDSINDEIRLGLENVIIEVDFMSLLKKCLIEYKSTANYLLRLVINPTLNTLFDLSDQTQDILDELNIKGEGLKNQLVSLVSNNLILLRKDFNLKYEINELKCLLISKNELIKSNKLFSSMPNNLLNEISNILIEKSVFLIRKFIIRKYKEKDIHNENYVFLGEEISFDLISHKLNHNIFDYWDEYSYNHFLSEENYEKQVVLKKEAIKILSIGYKNAFEFHAITKYFKDLDENIENLQELVKTDIILKKVMPFDDYSLNHIDNYIANNIFSKKVDQLVIDLNIYEVESFINKEIEKIKKLQQKSQTNNFFPYFKICEFLIKYIEEKISFKDRLSEGIIKEIKVALNILKNNFESFTDNLKWSKIHLNFAYRLPYNECLVVYRLKTQVDINIFCSSTFSLPIDLNKYDSFKNETAAFIIRIENQTKGIEDLSFLMDKFQKEKDTLESEINKNKQQNIELLGIFSAVIAILFSGVTTSQSSEKFENKFLTLITMFVILAAFLLMLRAFITNKDSNNKNDTTIINISLFIIIPILLTVILILFKVYN